MLDTIFFRDNEIEVTVNDRVTILHLDDVVVKHVANVRLDLEGEVTHIFLEQRKPWYERALDTITFRKWREA